MEASLPQAEGTALQLAQQRSGNYGLSIPEAAEIAGISSRTMWRLIGAGEVKSIRASVRRRIVMRSELDRYLSHGITQ